MALPLRTLAAAQTVPIRGDIAANVEQHLRLIRIAAQEQAQVLVFPELSLTGYELDLARQLAFTTSDARLAPLVEVVSRSSTIVIVGAPVRIGSRFFLGALILSPDGSVGLYTKHHLGAFSSGASADGVVPPAEATVFEAGTADPLVAFGNDAAAVAICADTGRPSHAQAAADRGATIYLASVFSIPSDFERERANLRAYAARHSMAVVVANYGGPSGGLASAGRSAIWSDRGELVAELETKGAGVVVAREDHAGWSAKTVMLDRGDRRAPEVPSPQPSPASHAGEGE
jgi:predicted amidohydrolase